MTKSACFQYKIIILFQTFPFFSDCVGIPVCSFLTISLKVRFWTDISTIVISSSSQLLLFRSEHVIQI